MIDRSTPVFGDSSRAIDRPVRRFGAAAPGRRSASRSTSLIGVASVPRPLRVVAPQVDAVRPPRLEREEDVQPTRVDFRCSPVELCAIGETYSKSHLAVVLRWIGSTSLRSGVQRE